MEKTRSGSTCSVLLALFVGVASGSAAGQGWTHVDYPIPTPNCSPFSITAGPDGNIWFTEYSSRKIGRVTPDGHFDEFDVPQGEPFAIGSGPDGNLWFGIYSASYQFGRITPSGTITPFSLSMPFANMYGISSGPDGKVWATLFCDDAVFRIDPADGTFTRFPIPTGGGCPYGITGGSDGNIWFTEHYRNKIGRITSDGQITEFRIGPVDAGNPNEIVSGPDGNLWATDNFSWIQRITPAGLITKFPNFVGNLIGLASTPSGLWAGNYGSLARISVLGAHRTFNLPDSDHAPRAIASADDGSIWFIEAYTNAIGRLIPGSGLSILAPCRLLDTRAAAGPALSAQATRTFRLADTCGVPAEAVAVAVNVTVTNPTDDGALVLYSTDIPRPGTSTVAYTRGRTRANNAILALGADGAVAVFCDQTSGTADFILDVVGYFPQ